MEALNAITLTPLTVPSDRTNEPRKISFKNLCSTNFSRNCSTPAKGLSRNLHGGLVILSSALNTSLAKALTYDEALQQSTTTSTSELDPSAVLETVTSFVSENPLVIASGVAILVVPLVLSRLLSKFKPWGVQSAKIAYEKLGDDANAQLLDIRASVELRQVGSPDIRGLKKKPVTVVYKGEDKQGFLKKVALKFKEPENTTLFILDKFDGNSELVAELVTENGFKAAYAIKDGVEGSRGWMNSGLPWILPKKSFDLGNLSDALDGVIGEGSDAVTVGLGVAAATGLGLLAFSEVEAILQVLGSAALVQLVGKKLLFAEDRKKTLQQVDEFFTTKVASKELVDGVKQFGTAILPTPETSKAPPSPAPAPAEASPAAASSSVDKTESVPNVDVASSNIEASIDPTPEINSVPKSEAGAQALTGISRPLSPYPNYPDLKPPTSPMPSQP